MALPLLHSAASLLPNGARTFCRIPHVNLFPCSAIQVPLRRPVSPQVAKSLITREQLLSSIAARTSQSTQSYNNSLSRESVELATLIDVLPARVRTALQHHTALSQLVEVVLDLGRPVVARFTEGAQLLSRDPVTQEELEEVTSKACICTADSCFVSALQTAALLLSNASLVCISCTRIKYSLLSDHTVCITLKYSC